MSLKLNWLWFIPVLLFLNCLCAGIYFYSSFELCIFSELRLTGTMITLEFSAMLAVTRFSRVLLSNLKGSTSTPSRLIGEKHSPSADAQKLKSYSSECAQLSDSRNGRSSCFSTSARLSLSFRRKRDWCGICWETGLTFGRIEGGWLACPTLLRLSDNWYALPKLSLSFKGLCRFVTCLWGEL